MNFSKILVFNFCIGLTLFARSTFAAEYNIDTTHSEITFKVKHMGISTVTGKFEKFGGTFSVDPKNVKATKGMAEIDVNSITTSNPKRDGHLKGDEFFDVAHFPSIKFVSKEVRDVNEADSTCTLVGDLTMRGITKEILLKVKGGGVMKDDWGFERAAFSAVGHVNRFDYGLKWNKAIETGGFVVGQDVELNLSFEGMRKLDAVNGKQSKGAKPSSAGKK